MYQLYEVHEAGPVVINELVETPWMRVLLNASQLHVTGLRTVRSFELSSSGPKHYLTTASAFDELRASVTVALEARPRFIGGAPLRTRVRVSAVLRNVSVALRWRCVLHKRT